MQFAEIIRLIGFTDILKVCMLMIAGAKETRIRLPDGSSLLVELDQLPELFNNLLHIHYYRDYAFQRTAMPRSGWKVIDVGAYIGAYTIWCARRVGDKGEVVALEPHPRNFTLLKRNININRLRNVKVLPYALSSYDGGATLYSPKYRALASLRREHVEYLSGGPVEKYNVKCITLRTLLETLNLNHVELLKLDIEGLEYKVLENSLDILDRIERLVVEAHLDICSIPEIDQLLRNAGYQTSIKLDTQAENQAFIIAIRK